MKHPLLNYAAIYKVVKPHPKSSPGPTRDIVERIYRAHKCSDKKIAEYFKKVDEAIPGEENLQLLLDSGIYQAASGTDKYLQAAAKWFHKKDMPKLQNLQKLFKWYQKKEKSISVVAEVEKGKRQSIKIAEALRVADFLIEHRITMEGRKKRGAHQAEHTKRKGVSLAISLLVVEGKLEPEQALNHVVDLLASHPVQSKPNLVKHAAIRKIIQRFARKLPTKRKKRSKSKA